MKEKLIDIYDSLINDNQAILSLVKIDLKFIVEKCILNKNKIKLIYRYEFDDFKQAKKKYNEKKRTI